MSLYLLLLALALTSLVLTACGGGGDQSASTGTAAASARIHGFGSEATGARAKQAEATLRAYLGAASKGQWAKACSYLAERVQKARAGVAKSRGLENENCAAGLKESAEGLSTSERAGLEETDISAVRVNGRRGYVLYEDASGVPRAMSIVSEGGDWKLFAPFAIQGTPLESE